MCLMKQLQIFAYPVRRRGLDLFFEPFLSVVYGIDRYSVYKADEKRGEAEADIDEKTPLPLGQSWEIGDECGIYSLMTGVDVPCHLLYESGLAELFKNGLYHLLGLFPLAVPDVGHLKGEGSRLKVVQV